ncbi:MAG: NAD(P)-binding protein [Microcoleus sp. SIO2G3]|nr:NAD(P)-binding protein [Microcoleus sp. SIO2G3]
MFKNNSNEFSASPPLKIAIIGAGIGGLATAIALMKKGFDVQVYEQAHALQPVGAGLTLLPNGLNSLDAIKPGIVESLIDAGSQTRLLKLKKSTGEMIASKTITLMQEYGQPMLNIRWSRLQEILASELPSDIIQLNHRCQSFEQNDDGVKIYFDGANTVQADLLIGADGLNSAVRQVLIRDGSPNYAGRLSWRSVVKYSHELLLPDESTLITAPDGKNFLLVDVGDGYIFWSAGALSVGGTLASSATEVKSRVLEVFAGWAQPVQEIVNATRADRIVERLISDRPPLPSWSSGRVMLLGDAAHPMVPSLGQGANTAFEDAYELSECLANAPSLEAAFEAYEKSRILRTEVIYARSAFQGRRAYDADSETTLSQMMEQIQEVSSDEFDEWLFNYNPSARDFSVLNLS